MTIVGLGATAHQSLDAAKVLPDRGIEAEVADLRSLVPLDHETIIRSASKTGRQPDRGVRDIIGDSVTPGEIELVLIRVEW